MWNTDIYVVDLFISIQLAIVSVDYWPRLFLFKYGVDECIAFGFTRGAYCVDGVVNRCISAGEDEVFGEICGYPARTYGNISMDFNEKSCRLCIPSIPAYCWDCILHLARQCLCDRKPIIGNLRRFRAFRELHI
jgi:hypothetical protein